jgi:hypothetical protein
MITPIFLNLLVKTPIKSILNMLVNTGWINQYGTALNLSPTGINKIIPIQFTQIWYN